MIDPTSIKTLGCIHIDLPPNSIGLEGVSADSDDSVIYVEGPIADDPNGCCSLYSIDLATLWMNQAASIPGGGSGIKGMSNDRLHVSPDGHWLSGVRSFRGPALDVDDLVQGSLVRQLMRTRLEGDWFPSGAWSGDHFYFYASKDDGSSARLWMVSRSMTDLVEGIAVDPIVQSLGCPPNSFALEEIAATRNNLFVYEVFGFIGDRRIGCSNLVQGGAWLVDSSNGQLLDHVASDLHFSVLIPEQEEPALYSLSSWGPTGSLR